MSGCQISPCADMVSAIFFVSFQIAAKSGSVLTVLGTVAFGFRP